MSVLSIVIPGFQVNEDLCGIALRSGTFSSLACWISGWFVCLVLRVEMELGRLVKRRSRIQREFWRVIWNYCCSCF